MRELTHGMAGERHGHGMLCVNPPLLVLPNSTIHHKQTNKQIIIIIIITIIIFIIIKWGWDIAVDIATRYGLDGPGIESRWGRDFPHPSRPSLLYNGYRIFPVGKAAGAWR